MARYHQITANSYYEAGKSLGSLKASEIKRVLGDYKSSDFRCAVLRYLATEEGQRQYKELNNTVRMRCAEYVDELQGVADGSDCDYNDLFEMNVDCEMTAAIELVPVASHGVSYLAYMDGCTNVSIQTPGGNVNHLDPDRDAWEKRSPGTATTQNSGGGLNDLLRQILSDTHDVKFPVYRSGLEPDYLATAGTGVYNVAAGSCDVYFNMASDGPPDFSFTVPKSTGSLKASEIKRVLGDYKSSDFRRAVLRFLATEEGHRQYKELNNTVRMRCAEYVDELQGVADGSDCDYNDLFEMNVDCEMTAAIALVPVASHGVSYWAYMDGCTNVSIQTPGGNVYFGHTEDISPQMKDLSCMVTMEIRDGNNQVIEHWTDFVVPGLLPGSKFGFNKHGVMFGHNNVYQQGLNAAGIRIASAFSFNFLERTTKGFHVKNTLIEAAGCSSTKPMVAADHLDPDRDPWEERSPGTATTQNSGGGLNDLLRQILSDTHDVKFPVYRSGLEPDYLATAGTGVYNVAAGSCDVYFNMASDGPPDFSFIVPKSTKNV
ncbi:hypothetical protein MAR_025250 [Mya arenaria]|uniref:Peptidase C45 hydrolase domain-containing protein n=1 Tax=Mya arenaria TaxID=6604 RepID=A0ABY7DW35_MYAAR|nr:hypothetical protein MAR_025250 [Mya arenaria]